MPTAFQRGWKGFLPRSRPRLVSPDAWDIVYFHIEGGVSIRDMMSTHDLTFNEVYQILFLTTEYLHSNGFPNAGNKQPSPPDAERTGVAFILRPGEDWYPGDDD